jgi:hypothetical protein
MLRHEVKKKWGPAEAGPLVLEGSDLLGFVAAELAVVVTIQVVS